MRRGTGGQGGAPGQLPVATRDLPVVLLRSGAVLPGQVSWVPADPWAVSSSGASSAGVVVACFVPGANGAFPTDDAGERPVGVACRLLRVVPDGRSGRELELQGEARVRVQRGPSEGPSARATVAPLPDAGSDDAITLGRAALVLAAARRLVELAPASALLPLETLPADAARRATFPDLLAVRLDLPSAVMRKLMGAATLGERLGLLERWLADALAQAHGGGPTPAQGAAPAPMQGATQRTAEPGACDLAAAEASRPTPPPADPEAAVEALPAAARAVARVDLERLAQAATSGGDTAPLKSHLDWMLALPWHVPEAPAVDLVAARTALDRELVGIPDVKERVLEFLAVLRPGNGHPVTPICLVGPHGTGKATLARSIAAASGRRFVRAALGGVGDDPRVKGVRPGQPTARPGEILDGLRRAGARDPVFLLDEIDALGADEVNDPAGALVEALDPESSCAFLDAYLGVPFDVSRVFFVATAGVVYDVPRAVRERMDVITLAGYTPDEKFLIARRSLLPRALDRAGLDPARVAFTDEALEQVVNGYTREAGVRSLARSLSRITRTLALRLRLAGKVPEQVDAAQVADLLGPAPYEDDPRDREPVVGLATGLSWTADGGVVQLIEATAMEGTGRIVVTGRLGDVMRESADIAYSWVRAHGASLGLDDARMQRLDLHIHAPEGGVRKDGPSAGVALATAIVSVFTGRAVLPDVAMTGELTLRGRVLDVAGIREKVSAAQRAGVHHVLLPGQNRKDVAVLPAALTRKMRFEFYDRIEDYLAAALVPAAPRP